MPIKSMDKMKGTSPSPNIQRGIDQAWGQQNKNSTSPQQVLSQKWTKKPVPVKGT